jgi:adenylate kinase family enzyme
METREIAAELISQMDNCGNEAEVRFKIIDRILCEVLNWPKSIIELERTYDSGRLDYLLEYPNGDPLMVVEAKSSEFDFSLPLSGRHQLSHHIKISALGAHSAVLAAMQQARSYATECGASYCCATNGKQWYFFKTTINRKAWDQQRAFYISDIKYFFNDYQEAMKHLAYDRLYQHNSLAEVCGIDIQTNRPTTIPFETIQHFRQHVDHNELAKFAKVICTDVFGEISESDHMLMEKCYVTEDRTGHQFEAARKEINDSLAPFFLNYRISDISNKKSTGKFEQQVTEIVKARLGKIIIVFGGRGAGKTTFLRRILSHQPPPGIEFFSQRAMVTLTDKAETKQEIQGFIYNTIIEKLDQKHILDSSRDEVLEKLFPVEFEKAKRFNLAGLKADTPEYIDAINKEFLSLRSNAKLTVVNLVKYWASHGKGVIIVIDNTDQYTAENQDYCFSLANEIAKESGCLAIVTMREERFYNSKLRGYLDAYGISSYHLKSPSPNDVFIRRLDYVIYDLLPLASTRTLYDLDESTAKDLNVFLTIMRDEFSRRPSVLSDFIVSCSHGDIRMALDFFKDFLVSGYLNVREMLEQGRWNLLFHQVIKPMMVPQNYFYSEKSSRIMNLYRIRDAHNGSHFTAIRILKKLSIAVDAYHPMALLSESFTGVLQMQMDFRLNIDELLKRGMIESDNRTDYFSDDIQKIKITAFGLYVLNNLSNAFTYLDLIVVDTPIFDPSVSASISSASNHEIKQFWSGAHQARMNTRIAKVNDFVEYLKGEEERECNLYGIETGIVDQIRGDLDSQYEIIKKGVKISLKRKRAASKKVID